MEAFVPGIYPRSEELVQATRDLDRGRTTQDAVDERRARDLEQFLLAQREAGLDLVASGMLAWQDLFRPLVEASDGLATGALTRFLDTNTFYRAPHAGDEQPTLRAAVGEAFFPPLPDRYLVTLPSPFAFSVGTGLEPRVLAESVLKPALEGLAPELVVLSEPFLARADAPDLDALAEALGILHGDAPVALWITFGDAGPLFERGLADLPVDGIGVDFYATAADALPSGFEKHLLAGVVDVRNSLVEDPREIAAFAAQLRRRIERVALVPNGDLQYVSERIAREKVTGLGQVRIGEGREAA